MNNSFSKKNKINLLKFLFLILIVFIIYLILQRNKKVERYSETKGINTQGINTKGINTKGINTQELFNDLTQNHYKNIFPNNANRNSAGFRFFKYIYDNLAINEELFDLYNSFYCAVSGSIVDLSRNNNFNILKVNDINGNCVIGKYYRCCTPCNCDIMKYSIVINTNIEMPKGSNKFIQRKLLTIGDPCEKLNNSASQTKLPNGLDSNVFKCNNNLLELGYRVNSENNLTMNEGRLVIGVLFDLNENDNSLDVDNSINICTTNDKRLYSSPNDLKYGMGDIFVKLALINNDKIYKNSDEDLCK